jgi:hypothetical protein
MALKPGVRGQLRITVDDKNGNKIPDITIALEGSVPFFKPFLLDSEPRDLPVEVAREALKKAAANVPGPAGHALGAISDGILWMMGSGQKGELRLSFGDQTGDGQIDFEFELEGRFLNFKPLLLDTGAHNIPVQQALDVAERVASAFPPPANGIAMVTLGGLGFLFQVAMIPAKLAA